MQHKLSSLHTTICWPGKMKYLFSLAFIHFSLLLSAQKNNKATGTVSPLARYSNEWNNTKYSLCNTACKASYLSPAEKEVIYILNLVRSYPALFAKTVLNKFPSLPGRNYLPKDVVYYQSLKDTLLTLKPKSLLYPDSLCFVSARCHAIQSGIEGTKGHTRTTGDCIKNTHYNAECCDYGNKDPLAIVLSLLIDLRVPSLGHRKACLDNYKLLGVSIRPHELFGSNAVLDFYY